MEPRKPPCSVRGATEQTARKRGKSNSQKTTLPAAQLHFSCADLKLADRHALNMCIPSGYRWKPCTFFYKKSYIKSYDWKQDACTLYVPSNVDYFLNRRWPWYLYLNMYTLLSFSFLMYMY